MMVSEAVHPRPQSASTIKSRLETFILFIFLSSSELVLELASL